MTLPHKPNVTKITIGLHQHLSVLSCIWLPCLLLLILSIIINALSNIDYGVTFMFLYLLKSRSIATFHQINAIWDSIVRLFYSNVAWAAANRARFGEQLTYCPLQPPHPTISIWSINELL